MGEEAPSHRCACLGGVLWLWLWMLLQVLTVLCWSLNFWQSSSALSGEIEDLNVAFPSAMVTALWMCVVLLGLTVLAGTGASSESQSAWTHQLFLASVAGTRHSPQEGRDRGRHLSR
jgi:hypothetical protein